ncbi:hypothetical protein CAI21_09245 [Alkalilimnicola ehrlichii]|uniref:DUF3545 domain-containing protein n=1 Tax=Alkalilimnicola ehrlichii TaxID=351052 RepID=A0A3E0WPC4_9GAMM|nr:hypothetical protein [Alkalilimnicola ehrlichii]RFA29985.1 hypothetical protein CAI21_09245 [Alkalilimnicola ehrlichii]RFA33805.1 hypothetical protein CAL65_16915 [Alkalilimnicola ehrlichii]
MDNDLDYADAWDDTEEDLAGQWIEDKLTRNNNNQRRQRGNWRVIEELREAKRLRQLLDDYDDYDDI